MTRDIKTLSEGELSEIFQELGEPKYRAKQLYEWLHNRNASTYDEMTNLPKSLREKLSQEWPLSGICIYDKRVSTDGTRKYIFELDDGVLVEAVGIPAIRDTSDTYTDESAGDNLAGFAERLTVCFSTQAGCQMRCSFCATGKAGFIRNLTSSEIVDQITAVKEDFAKDASESNELRVNNVVAMGQGEPFLNYEELIEALRRINNDPVLGIGARRITVSTCGIIDGVYRFADEPEQYRLAISLHSADQETRNQIMPALANQPLKRLKEALLDYNLQRNRRITLEYMMIDGVNDGQEDLSKLIKFCEGLICHVNLIPMNSVDGTSYKSSTDRHIHNWENSLKDAGIPVSIRYSKGSDIAGACGQLVNSISD